MVKEKIVIKTDFKDNLEVALEGLKKNSILFEQHGMRHEEVLTDMMILELTKIVKASEKLIGNIKERRDNPHWMPEKDIEIY